MHHWQSVDVVFIRAMLYYPSWSSVRWTTINHLFLHPLRRCFKWWSVEGTNALHCHPMQSIRQRRYNLILVIQTWMIRKLLKSTNNKNVWWLIPERLVATALHSFAKCLQMMGNVVDPMEFVAAQHKQWIVSEHKKLRHLGVIYTVWSN